VLVAAPGSLRRRVSTAFDSGAPFVEQIAVVKPIRLEGLNNEADRLQRIERVREIKQAVTQQGTSVERRAASGERRADRWVQWFHYRMEKRGGDVAQYLPDMAAELEETIQDEITAAIRQLGPT
jgi:hypothetical protein